MNKIIGIIAVVIIMAFSGFIFISNKQSLPASSSSEKNISSRTTDYSPTPITDIQASFAIFTNGTFRIFTASMYHNLSQDVYIEASNPNVVQVKKAGTTWNDFFSTLPFTVTSECLTTGTNETFCTGKSGTLQFYLNGEKNDNALSQEIKDDDKLLVTFGSKSPETTKRQIERIPNP